MLNILTILLILFLPAEAMGQPAPASLVSVVGLDRRGEPSLQGMGVIWGKPGQILTCASLLSPGGGVIVKTGGGDLHLMAEVLHRDDLQDLALIRIDQEMAAGQPLRGSVDGIKPPEKVWVGVRQEERQVWQEAEVAKTYPFSPRLVLMKLLPTDLAAPPGSPVINRRGELIGMLHAFENDPACKFYLRWEGSLPAKQNQARMEQAAKAGQDSPAKGGPMYAAFWRGVTASLENRWPEAGQAFAQAISQGGSEKVPEAYYGRGMARYHQGDFSGAAKDLETATRLLPGYALAFLRLGEVQERLGKSGEARLSYETASQASPDLEEAWFHLGEMAYREGDFHQARKYLERAGDAFPAQRWWYLGAMAQAQQHWSAAVKAFSQAIQHDPGLFQAYLDKGQILLQALGRPEEAKGVLAEAVRLRPRQAQARYYLGLASLMSCNPKEAWQQYFALEGLAPRLAANLGTILEKQP